ncbi:serine hydroxymethyltransferase 7 [Mercurialis annua]|uniref:serine hydroxymethyltransferase 7 n=1 Tax=Mercurialis annua TaxID=3986 RepID=UPI00215EE08F|nr:serine hydroxymethyltransferase 7 [Mercurialis annua]
MDLSQAQSGLSLGFHSHTSSNTNPIPLQLLDQKDEVIEKFHGKDDDHLTEEEENFSILGHPMCLKRQRGGDAAGQSSSSSSSSPNHPPKRAAIEQPGLESRRAVVRAWGNQPLPSVDPEIHQIMEKEKHRQVKGIELIASENFVSRAVMEALGSHLTNKYSEGLPGARYYTGNQYIDQIESICCSRAIVAFGLDSDKWGVNVQPYSCTSANFAVYSGLLLPGDRIMGLDSPSGGHLSHGYYIPGGKKVSASAIFFESLPYKVNPQTGYIDYDKMEEKAMDFRPKILICGGSSYPREWDYARFRQVADRIGAVLMCDMAHISGLVAAKECASPFNYCDIVTSTTHKSLRGPRGGIIFYRKGPKPRKQGVHPNHGDGTSHYDLEERINFSVHPSLQGGPHNNHIAALAIALKQVATLEYKAYMQQVKKNARALASALLRRKCRLVTGGTDNHLLLWDLTTLGLAGKNYEKVCETCHITINKSAVYGENGVVCAGGVRIGTPAMTSRGCLEGDFEIIADFLLRAAQITSALQREHGKFQKEFLRSLQNNRDIIELRNRVETFASQFAMPGFDF